MTLVAPVLEHDVVSLTYTIGGNPIRDLAHNNAIALSNYAIVNTTDNTAPTLSNLSVIGSALTMSYDEVLDATSIPLN